MDCYITDLEISGCGAVALEDSIMVKGVPVTAGSKILENFKAPFSAETAERLEKAGFQISGKTKMNEFGIPDLFGDTEKALSGAATAVLKNAAEYALCNDLFGQYRREAAEKGLCYIHPTYGTVSRYGLIPMAASMDQIGVLCKDLNKGFSLLEAIAGKDEKDGAMLPEEKYSYKKGEGKLTVCAPSNVLKLADEDTQKAIAAFTENFETAEGDLEYFDVAKQVMYILSSAEISNNINRYDGIKFGYRSPDSKNLEDLYNKSRTEGFGLETKLAAIMGAMVLSAEQYEPYYEKAMKIRRLMKEAFSFNEFDIMVLPTSINGNTYENLSLYAVATLLGLPSVAFNYKGCGLQLIANIKNEDKLLAAWEVAK